MAWSWSHTEEAYENAQSQMEHLDRETREIIAAEWMGTDRHHLFANNWNLNMKKYRRGLRRAKRWDDDKLNEVIWNNMSGWERGRTCTNGGHEAYCCPHGCGPHMVPFAPIGEIDESTEDDD